MPKSRSSAVADGERREQRIDAKTFRKRLRKLQMELVKLQRSLIERNAKVLVILEGRDGAGKDGTIKRLVEHMSPRETRVVALRKPSDSEKTEWYFQRWVPHLPSAQEFVIFNRSWYNRAGVERVMGFCSDAEYAAFLEMVVPFERMLVRSDLRLFKYYLDIDKDEQIERLSARREDPLKQWKRSPIDDVAIQHWDEYSLARDAMLEHTHDAIVPWTVVRTNHKKTARINLIADLLSRFDYPGKKSSELETDAGVVFPFDAKRLAELGDS